MKFSRSAVLIAALAALSLTACGGEAAGGDGGTDTQQGESSYVDITDQQGSVEGFVGAIDDAEITRCESADGSWRGEGTVVNSTDSVQNYRLYVAFNKNSDTKGLVQVDIDSVAAGATAEWRAEAPLAFDDLRCVIRVERFSPSN